MFYIKNGHVSGGAQCERKFLEAELETMAMMKTKRPYTGVRNGPRFHDMLEMQRWKVETQNEFRLVKVRILPRLGILDRENMTNKK